MKNPYACARTVDWLKASFHILATASVLPNSIQDFDGFMKFVNMGQDLWSDESLARLKVSKTVNPFDLPDEHPATILRLTARAVSTFITGDTANPEKAGFYLQKV